ncbi:MAG: HAD-IA family hydrolase [Clostridia bacterium]|nr:HAD-IA family hydrolase [Clostridia bacterium]
MIEVSAGIIRRADGRILICQRGEGRKNAHLWEFPGGKREAGETAAACLRRELQEELSLPLTHVQELCTREAEGIRFTFLTAETDATPILIEHEDMRFVLPRDMLRYPFCPADTLVAQQLAVAEIRHFIWDFDGTLVDTYPAMMRAFAAAAADFGIAVTPERTLALMKDCLRHCCETVGGENGVSAEELLRAFRAHEKDELLRGVPAIGGVSEALRALHAHGGAHYVATHRDFTCKALLEQTGLRALFSGFVTQEDGLPRKPAPDMLLHLMRSHSLDPAQCVMIGDRPLDTLAGQAAGMLSVLIDPENRFPDAPCDLRITNPACLSDIFLQVKRGRMGQYLI